MCAVEKCSEAAGMPEGGAHSCNTNETLVPEQSNLYFTFELTHNHVTVGISEITLTSVTLNYLTSHLTGLMVSDGLGITRGKTQRDRNHL